MLEDITRIHLKKEHFFFSAANAQIELKDCSGWGMDFYFYTNVLRQAL